MLRFHLRVFPRSVLSCFGRRGPTPQIARTFP